MKLLIIIVSVAMVTTAASGMVAQAPMEDQGESLEVSGSVSAPEVCGFVQDWYDGLLEEHDPGTAVPLMHEPSDEELADLGLPPADELVEMTFEEPTMFLEDGETVTVSKDVLAPTEHAPEKESEPVHHRDGHDKGGDDGDDTGDDAPEGPGLATYAGTGCLGIRPGGWIFNLEGGTVSWCTLAHVYGDQISTAGHCAQTGDRITMIGLVGNNDLAPVLLDFGEVSTSRDNGVGDDWGLIDVYDQYQDLMTATMCFWGGPFLGTYENQGTLVEGSWTGQGPQVTVDPDPTLVEGIVHYGHGAGMGTGGTPRAGVGASWGDSAFVFAGAIGPGDSGSGANTATTEAAGIVTHIIVDPVMREGVGIAAGTRATEVGTPSMGLPVGTPVPLAVPSWA